MLTRLRTKALSAAGASWPVKAWASRRCGEQGVEVRRVGGAFELRKGQRAIRIAPKHIFFAPEMAEAFSIYARALPAVHAADGVSTVDFEANPQALNLCRRCLAQGVAIESREGDFWLRKDVRAMVLSERHMVYAADMAGSFDLYFSPLVPEKRDGLLVLDYSKPGRVQRYARSGLEFEMASFPEEEDAIEEYFRWYRPSPGDLVFDVGAHCGVSTYHLSKLVGEEGRVIAFEPDPGNFGILQRNIERHGLRNVVAQNAAIAGSSGELAFNAEGTIGSSLVALLRRDSVGSTVMVTAVTLAEAFERWGTPAFCKIDIEGAELEVIGGAGELLRGRPTQFALDTNHPKAGGEMTAADIEAMFRSYGYKAESEARPLLTTWARPMLPGE